MLYEAGFIWFVVDTGHAIVFTSRKCIKVYAYDYSSFLTLYVYRNDKK